MQAYDAPQCVCVVKAAKDATDATEGSSKGAATLVGSLCHQAPLRRSLSLTTSSRLFELRGLYERQALYAMMCSWTSLIRLLVSFVALYQKNDLNH